LLFLTGYGNLEVPVGRFHIVHDINSFRRYPFPAVYETDLSPIDYFHYYHGIPTEKLVDIFLGKLVKFFNRSDRAYVTWANGSVQLLLRSGFPKDLIHIIPLPIESPEITRGITSGHNILFIGGNFEDKGGPIALKAFDIVKRKIPDATLKLITRMNPGPLTDGAIWLGEVPNNIVKSEILPKADLLISPFKPNRPSYLSVLESIASGLPVIATYTPQSADYMVEGETGFLVRDYTPEAFARTVSDLLENTSLLESLSKKCVQFVKTRHNPQLVGRKLLDLYYKTMS
jgi:glycosyltransferase involved in cell wall biosynthesis